MAILIDVTLEDTRVIARDLNALGYAVVTFLDSVTGKHYTAPDVLLTDIAIVLYAATVGLDGGKTYDQARKVIDDLGVPQKLSPLP